MMLSKVSTKILLECKLKSEMASKDQSLRETTMEAKAELTPWFSRISKKQPILKKKRTSTPLISR